MPPLQSSFSNQRRIPSRRAFVLTANDVVSRRLMLLPSVERVQGVGVLCRPVGKDGSQRFMAFFPVERWSSYSSFDDVGLRVRLVPDHQVAALAQPADLGEIFMAYAQGFFAPNLNLVRVLFPKEVKGSETCELCRRKGHFHVPAHNIACTNVWGTAVFNLVCDHHYTKNHGIMADDVIA